MNGVQHRWNSSYLTQALAELGLSSGAYHLVIARLEPENHVLEILEGMRLSGSERTLAVVGDLGGPYARRCQRAAAGPGPRGSASSARSGTARS